MRIIVIEDNTDTTSHIAKGLKKLGHAIDLANDGKDGPLILKAVDIGLQYRYVDMPISATLANVESALKSLSDKDSQQAIQALADAQQGMIHDSVIINAVDENPAG